jgi:hypothetical protein
MKEGDPMERKNCGIFNYSSSPTSHTREAFQGEIIMQMKTSNLR